MHLGVRTLCSQTVTWYINTLLERGWQSGNSPYKWRNRGVFLGHAQGVFIPRDCLAAKAPYPLMHMNNERSTCKHHANGKITESQIFIYNKWKDIPLTYLLDQHCACISINIISGLACVITKVLISFHQHTYCCFQFFFLLYYSPTRAFPR